MDRDIQNYDEYASRMDRSMMDKAFFVDKTDAGLVVDFGCGSGALLGIVGHWMPESRLVGYDTDQEMLDIASANLLKDVPDVTQRAFLTTSWHQVCDEVFQAKQNGRKSLLVLSSVVHEVYNYSAPNDVRNFWKRAFETGFDYIVLRDMMPSFSIDRPSDVNDVSKVYSRFLHTRELTDFERCWGSVENNKNLVHFLLKYKYVVPNWEREVAENYFPLYREDFLSMIPGTHSVLFHEHYVLPHIKRTVVDELGIEIKDPTHLKAILRSA